MSQLDARPGRNPHDISTWGLECGRGIQYVEHGAPVAAGTKNVVRKISQGRKSHRGMSSDSTLPETQSPLSHPPR
jgi:hypothetical protein